MRELRTFSIVARCARTGAIGVAVASAIPAVGAISSHAAARTGAIATQAWCNPYLGIDGLRLLGDGAGAHETLACLLNDDPDRERRQLAIIDRHGVGAAWTGAECAAPAGHLLVNGAVIQGNTLTELAVLDRMWAAFEAVPDAALSSRLVDALSAGATEGGDARGKQSAHVLVFHDEEYPLVDVRVDDHSDPTTELRRVHEIATAQLAPFVEGMPRRSEPGRRVTSATEALLAASPPDRPGGGGARPDIPSTGATR